MPFRVHCAVFDVGGPREEGLVRTQVRVQLITISTVAFVAALYTVRSAWSFATQGQGSGSNGMIMFMVMVLASATAEIARGQEQRLAALERERDATSVGT